MDHKITVGADEYRAAHVRMLIDDKVSVSMPWQVALQVAHQLIAKARLAETEEKALSLIEDQKLLLRSGAPFAITSNKQIVHAAASDVGIAPRQSKVGPPTFMQSPAP